MCVRERERLNPLVLSWWQIWRRGVDEEGASSLLRNVLEIPGFVMSELFVLSFWHALLVASGSYSSCLLALIFNRLANFSTKDRSLWMCVRSSGWKMTRMSRDWNMKWANVSESVSHFAFCWFAYVVIFNCCYICDVYVVSYFKIRFCFIKLSQTNWHRKPGLMCYSSRGTPQDY